MTYLRYITFECDGYDEDGCPSASVLDTCIEHLPQAVTYARSQKWMCPNYDRHLCPACAVFEVARVKL